MNRKIAMLSSIINLIAVVGFAVSMLIGFNSGSYFFSMFIALSFMPMMWSFAFFSEKRQKLAGFVSAGFAAMYGAIILLVYFAQLTTVRLDSLSPEAAKILDFQQFGLFFNFDLLGYALMSLATFFAGLTVKAKRKSDKWLRNLLIVHGLFFISCLITPMLGLFKEGGASWVGVAVLEFWCVYFCPISILSYLHFSRCEK